MEDDKLQELLQSRARTEQQLENLRTHPAVAARLARNDLRIHGWVYEIETGQVYHYDPSEEQFLALSALALEAAASEKGGQR